MSEIILGHAQALALGEVKKTNAKPKLAKQEGNLQGRKVLPLAFYLNVIGSIAAGIAAVALVATAIAFSVFTLYIAAAALVALSLIATFAAINLYRHTPEKELDLLISKLSKKTKHLYANQEFNNNKPPMIENKYEKNIHEFRKQLDLQTQLLTANKKNIANYVKKHEEQKLLLQKHLNNIVLFLEEKECDPDDLTELKKEFKKLNWEENADEPVVIFQKMIQNNQDLYNKFSGVMPVLKKYIENYENSFNELSDKLAIIRTEKSKVEDLLSEVNSEVKQADKLLGSNM